MAAKKTKPKQPTMIHLRLPEDIRAWLRASAQAEYLTVTAKVIRMCAAEKARSEREVERA